MSAGSKPQTRRAARLLAVQALYQRDIAGGDPAALVAEFIEHRWRDGADRALFAEIVHGVAVRAADLDQMLDGALAEGWTAARLEAVLRALMRAGAFELLHKPDVPAPVVIKEYVALAHGFFAGREPALVNAVLDALAKRLREAEFAQRAEG